jgi:TRAP-type C4-dicarboxylate transport system permease small subunit
MEIELLRVAYRRTEQQTLICLLLSLPLFGIIYLYQQAGNLNKTIPQLPFFAQVLVLVALLLLLTAHYFLFHRRIKATFVQEELSEKILAYLAATNPGFVVVFALALVFFSLGKPSPDRMMRLLKLKKQDWELLVEISRPA